MKRQKNTVLVTGGASGIGRAVIESLLVQGWNVVVADFNAERIEKCRSEFKELGNQLLCEHLDITDEDAVCVLINKIESGDMDVPYETIYSYDKIVPNHPVYLYLRGLIEIDGNKAVEYYKALYSSCLLYTSPSPRD